MGMERIGDPMPKREQPVLKLRVRGPGVRKGRISVPDLVRICEYAQAAVKKQAEALAGRGTVHPGPVIALIQEECTLDLVGIKGRSTILEFGFAQPQIPIPDAGTVGADAISELALSIKSLKNGKVKPIDPGVLQSVYNLAGMVEGKKVTRIDWLAPKSGRRKSITAILDPIVRQRAAQRLSTPTMRHTHIDGVLNMVDFKPEDLRCRIDPAIGASIPCTFDSELADTVHQMLLKTVRAEGMARYAAYTERIESLHLDSLLPLPSLALGEGDFYKSFSLSELAEKQKVGPLRDPSALAGAIPAEQDVDAFIEAIYSERK